MKKRQASFLIGIVLLAFLLLLVLVAVVVMVSLSDRVPGFGRANVALLKIEGVLTEAEQPIRLLRKYNQTPGISAIVVRIESPGGAVGAAQELHREILKAREDNDKPIVASMGNIAASGGLYVASAAEEIHANPGTVTGSIGVIFRTYNLEGISKKIGIGTNTVKSGKYKDIGSSFREMTPQEREIIQAAVDDTYDQFLEAIIEGRRLALAEAYLQEKAEPTSPGLDSDAPTTPTAPSASPTEPENVPREVVKRYLRSIADGRVYTGRQAQTLGLVDHLGDMHDAIDRAAELAGVAGRPHVVQEKRRTPMIWDLMEGHADVMSRLGLPNGVSLEYRLCFD